MFKFKKFYSYFLAFGLLFSFLGVFSNVSAKIRCDCIFSVGPACRPAQWLRKTHKRFQASPLDWMMKYSLDSAMHCFKTKFADYFEDIEATGEVIGNHRVVKDKKNGVVSMHHFSKNVSLDDAKKDVREKMLGRGKKVDEILKNSRSIILICNRQRDSFDDFKRFINNFSKLYPERNIALVNIHNNGSGDFTKSVLYEGTAAVSKKKSKIKPKSDKKSKQNKKRRRKLKIIQYSFNDDASNWEGNPDGWQRVMDDIELTNRNFDKDMDFKQVEF